MSTTQQILIVEDEPRIRKLFCAELNEAGFHTLEAPNDDNLVDLVGADESIQLVLLDVTRSNSLGQKILNRIRKRRPGVKILISSIYRQEERVSTIRNADGYYCKSDNLETLTRKIRTLLESHPLIAMDGK